MDIGLFFTTHKELYGFLIEIDNQYMEKIANISLFNIEKTSQWSKEQKQLFVRLFYHARGHFYKFLWCIGSRTTQSQLKSKVIENIQEEFNEKSKSHESLYHDFSKALEVNVQKEIYEEKYYLPFLRTFDKNHIQWIVEAKSECSLVAFLSAYEKLDNIDYKNLLSLAKNIGVENKESLLFFLIHSNANHFDRLYALLQPIWDTSKKEVIEAFEFIYSNQLNMWSLLSREIEKCG